MSNDYNVDDVLSKIKSQKSKQGKGTIPPVPEKINPKSGFQIDKIEQFAQSPQNNQWVNDSEEDYPIDTSQSGYLNQNRPNLQPTAKKGDFGFSSSFKLETDIPPESDNGISFDIPEADIIAQSPINRPVQSPTPSRTPRIPKPEEHTQVFHTPNKAAFSAAAQQQKEQEKAIAEEEEFDFADLPAMTEKKSGPPKKDLDFAFGLPESHDSLKQKKPTESQPPVTANEMHVDIKPKKNLLKSLFHRLESMLPSTTSESGTSAPALPPTVPTPTSVENASPIAPSVPSAPTPATPRSAPVQSKPQSFFSNLESDMSMDINEDNDDVSFLDSQNQNIDMESQNMGNAEIPSFQMPFQQNEDNNYQSPTNHPTFDSVPSFAENDNHFQINIPDEDSFMVNNQNSNMDSFAAPPNTSRVTDESIMFSKKAVHSITNTDSISSLTNAAIPIPELTETDNEIDDYNSPNDREAIISDMKSIKVGLIIRAVACIVVFFISLYLALAARNIVIAGGLLPLPEFMLPEKQVRVYMIVSTLVVALAALICSNTVGGGILSLFKFHADTDALPALAVLGCMAQGVSYIVRPDFFKGDDLDSNLYLFFPVAILVLVFNLLGKLMVILRIQNNFKLVASDQNKYSVNFLTHRDVIREVSKGMSLEEYTIAYPEKAKFLTHFLDNSYSEDHAERISHGLAPACFIAAVLSGILSFTFNKNGAEAITTFTAVLCVCAPLTSTIAANLPLLRLSSKLIPHGAMIAGYSSVYTFSKTEAVILNSCDVFRPEDVVLHGIKAFDQGKIDSVILDAASVVCSTNGMLTAVFSKIIGANKTMLKPVENVTYEDNMGLSAWVDGKRVLIGNRELLMSHGVKVPSNDYEMRYVKDSKSIIYLSNSGELTAMFVISYNSNKEMQSQLNRAATNGLYLIVESSDPNITAEKIRDLYQFPIEQVKILPARVHQAYLSLTVQKESASSKIGFVGGGDMLLRTILNCTSIRSSISQSVLIQMIALVLGYGIITLFTLMGNLAAISVIHVILYQLVWAVIVMIVPNMKRL